MTRFETWLPLTTSSKVCTAPSGDLHCHLHTPPPRQEPWRAETRSSPSLPPALDTEPREQQASVAVH